MSDPDTRELRLSDGRILTYSDTGNGEKGTWFHCHGVPGSRYELSHLEDETCASGLRLIVPDRPGYGSSTPCSQYGFAQHTADLRQLADHLGLERFAISGFSGGGVFALAAAHDLGDRINKLCIAATPAVSLMQNPHESASELTAGTWRAALQDRKALADDLKVLTGSAEVLSQALMEAAGQQEERYLSSVAVRPGFMRSLEAALNQGPEKAAAALARDSFLTAGSWPFQPKVISAPVRVVHGSDDGLVFPDHAVALASRLRDSTSHVLPGGHYEALAAIWL